MRFQEKLIFLMNLTSATNKSLAASMQVHPSMISRLRQGHSEAPCTVEYTRNMSQYFAQHITTDYQRAALAETLEQRQLRLLMGKDALAEAICTWLSGQEAGSGEGIRRVFSDMDAHPVAEVDDFVTEDIDLEQSAGICRPYYGNEGKRVAVFTFLRRLLLLERTGELLVCSDENLEWMMENAQFAANFTALLTELANSGVHICRIAPRINDMADAIDSFRRWLPIYMTGMVDSWHYPRLRDNVLHRTLLVVPGVGAVSSCSVGFQPEAEVTFLYEDSRVADALSREFVYFQRKCVPLTTSLVETPSSKRLLERLRSFTSAPGNIVRKRSGLVSDTLPQELIARACSGYDKAINDAASMCRRFEERVKSYKATDVICLPPLEDILAGRVVYPLSLIAGRGPVYYTPAEYRQHLSHALKLMEKYPQYTIVIDDTQSEEDAITVIEGTGCLLFRSKAPFTIFEIREQHIAAAAEDYIISIMDSMGKKAVARRKTMDKLSDMIEKLPKQ